MAIVSANGAANPLSPNYIINGAFDFWQRGTSFSVANGSVAYTADRFFTYGYSGSSTYSQQTFAPGSAPQGYDAKYFLRQVAGSGARIYVEHKIEEVRTLATQTVTLSFWAKAGTTFTLNAAINQDFGSGGSAYVDGPTASFSLTTSWARYSMTVVIPSVSGKTIGNNSNLTVVLSSIATAQTLDIWGVQLEAGSIATPFRRNAPSLQAELAACQRYYEKSTSLDVLPNSDNSAFPAIVNECAATPGQYQSDGWGTCRTVYRVEKRKAPVLTTYNVNGTVGVGAVYYGGASSSANTSGTKVGNTNSFILQANASGISTGAAYVLRFQWAADAEL